MNGLRVPVFEQSRYTAAALGGTALGIFALVPAIPHVLSALLLIAFVALAPGCATLAWVRPPTVTRALVIPALGLAAVIVVTTAAALVGWWTPEGLFAIIALPTVWSTAPNLGALARDIAP